MHIALATADIVGEILSHIRQDSSKESKQTLCHAALVCKQFLPYALDALWFSMDKLNPLMALIPEASKMPRKDVDNMLAFTCAPRMQDLSAFDAYARRINELELPAKHSVSVPVVLELLDCLGRRHLLPRLRVLTLNRAACDLNEADTFLFCPSLERLNVELQSQSDLCYLLPRLARTAHSLRHLKIIDQAIPQQMIHLTGYFKMLKALETKNEFILSAESPEPFLSTFPFAESLTDWQVSSIIYCPDDSSSSTIIQFPMVTTLELTESITAKEIITLRSHSLFPKLHSYTFCMPVYTNSDSAAYKESLRTLCSHLFADGLNNLQFLCMRADVDLVARRSEIQMDLEEFLPEIQTYPTLKTLWLAEQKLLSRPTIASVDRLSALFPCLTDLYLHLHNTALVSFAEVARLATNLPQLRVLDIGINGRNLEDPPSVPLLSHPLEELCLRNSFVGSLSIFLFVRYVDRLFPFAILDDEELPDNGQTVRSALQLVRDCRNDQEERLAPKPKPPLRRSKRIGPSNT